MKNIIPVILCGGNGTRLWPQSRKTSPKQFQQLITENTMFQDTVLRVDGMGTPIVVTNQEHLQAVNTQLAAIDRNAEIIVEPVGRNTAPAIAAAAGLVRQREESSIMVVLPSDHLIKDKEAFDHALGLAIRAAKKNQLVTFGIEPVRPETGYGYIRLQDTRTEAAPISGFIEKPDLERAKEYMASGNYVWNSGMFVFRANVFLDELKRYQPALSSRVANSLERSITTGGVVKLHAQEFSLCPDISIDYAVMEETQQACCVRLDAQWNDLGGWSAVWEESSKDADANALIGDIESVDTKGCLIHASDRLIASIGVEDLVIVDTPDSLLVAHKDKSHLVKKVVANLEASNRSEHLNHKEVERPWGTYKSIDQGEHHQVKHITVEPGQSLSKQMHHHRSEHWIVVAGTALVEIDEQQQLLAENESCYIAKGAVHRLTNPGKVTLHLIEVQNGTYLGEDDIVRFEDIYGRAA